MASWSENERQVIDKVKSMGYASLQDYLIDKVNLPLNQVAEELGFSIEVFKGWYSIYIAKIQEETNGEGL